MRQPISARSALGAVAVLLGTALVCLIALTCTAVGGFQEIAAENRSYAESFVPAKRLTTGFEREILNARVFFVYHVTIQKPGTLEAGWARHHNAEERLAELSRLVDQQEELRPLRAPVGKLRTDLANYDLALSEALSRVRAGEHSGARYDAQVTEWAARDAVLVGDAADAETLCSRLGEENTNQILEALKQGQLRSLSLCIAGALFCTSFALFTAFRLRLLRVGRQAATRLPSPNA